MKVLILSGYKQDEPYGYTDLHIPLPDDFEYGAGIEEDITNFLDTTIQSIEYIVHVA